VFLTVTDSDKAAIGAVAAQLHDLGFEIAATGGTAGAIARMGIPVERLNKLGEGSPHVVDKIEGGDVVLVINTPTGTAARSDGYEIRRAAIARGIPCITTMAGGMAAARAIAAARHGVVPEVRSLQEIHRANATGVAT
jgi:carbamoyl-phosphate synthase large subunit